jgi:hypothetical protein
MKKKKLLGKSLKRNEMKAITGGVSGAKYSQCFDYCMDGCTNTNSAGYCKIACQDICG